MNSTATWRTKGHANWWVPDTLRFAVAIPDVLYHVVALAPITALSRAHPRQRDAIGVRPEI